MYSHLHSLEKSGGMGLQRNCQPQTSRERLSRSHVDRLLKSRVLVQHSKHLIVVTIESVLSDLLVSHERGVESALSDLQSNHDRVRVGQSLAVPNALEPQNVITTDIR
jgi:hypothetical protein